jgi:hypothetical protein
MQQGDTSHGRVTGKLQTRQQLLAALLALALGSGCSLVGSSEDSQRQNRRNLEGDSCGVTPTITSNPEPELQWEWTGSSVLPEFKQVMMTPIVIEVNGDGIPDIVFNSFAGTAFNQGVLRAISGDDGHDLWANTNPLHFTKALSGLAAGDIDGDGLVELCGIPGNGRGIICFENDGTFKFRSAEDAFDYNEWGAPSLADLDGDGTVEILDGNRVYSNTGALKWVGSDGMGGAQYTGPTSFGADIDQDGKQELVNGRSVYKHDGSLKCANTTIPHGTAAVGNFDGDQLGEIAVAGNGQVSLLDDSCALLWTAPIPGGCADGCGGAPILADVDSDGLPEIAVSGDNAFSVFETNGTVKWTSTIQDWSSGKASASAFDFEDDGQIELVFADEVALRIYNGNTGAVRFQTRHSTGTGHEYPVIADVDGDQSADIVVAANNVAYPPYNGIRVYHERTEGWARARALWNQHAYSVTNVNNNGSIPARPVSHWRQPKLNTFHSNPANYTGAPPPGTTDLIPENPVAECLEGGAYLLGVHVANQGLTEVPAGIHVAFYRGTASSNRVLLGVVTTQEPIPSGESLYVSLVLDTAPPANAELFVVVDDDGTGTGSEPECREDNNSAPVYIDSSCTPPNAPPVAMCRNVTVNADASCQASASVDNGSHDPDQQPGPFSVSQAPAGPYGLGNHQVTLTASDDEASAQCVGTVTVVDNTQPSVSCPASKVIETCAPGGDKVHYDTPSSDNCGAAPVTCSHPSGTLFPAGTTAVSCSARDGSGNTASCGFDVTVRGDTTPPTISCPINVEARVRLGEVSALVDFTANASDSCGQPQMHCSHPPGTLFLLGLTQVRCTATDGSGNSASCQFGVRVSVDVSLP